MRLNNITERSSAKSPRPWGVLSTLGWTLLALATSGLMAVALTKALVLFDKDLSDYRFLLRGGHPLGSLVVIVFFSVLIAVIVFAAHRSQLRIADYLAFVSPRGRYLLLGFASVAFPLLVAWAHGTHFDVGKFFTIYGFDEARAKGGTGGVVLRFIAVAIVAPLAEEIIFRGFLYRGLSQSAMGVIGAICLTSLAWSVSHLGRDWTGMIDLTVQGVAWGLLRWHTGSLYPTLGWHIANNAFFTLGSIAIVYGWVIPSGIQ